MKNQRLKKKTQAYIKESVLYTPVLEGIAVTSSKNARAGHVLIADIQ